MTNDEQRPKLPSISLAEVERNKRRRAVEEERATREAREQHDKSLARRSWVDEGGDDASFEKAWSQIQDGLRRQRVAEKQEQVRRNLERYYQGSF
jgi:hypothetical protein